ncbi:M48 family metalloprotease [Bremerella sp. P1]|uniref:M48 family metalloprotease n=1 Tax=Bremerella sp. P1 TaxID=3026424 RepID=UPI002367A412|nr:M48 family metalloprotease [Bremerella sp. P1]WDI43926.1 M48 family metalloprotease [Bremerella sp. P1]
MQNDVSSLGFVKTYVYPALALFLIPIVCLFFYEYVQSTYDQEFLEAAIAEINADATMTPAEKAQNIEAAQNTPLSWLLVIDDPEVAAWRSQLPTEYLYYNLSIIWAIRISWFCILAGIGAFMLTGLTVLLSLKSQWMQYYSLLLGWHTLRIFCTLEVIAQALLVFSLSFWIPAFFFNIFIVKLLFIIGIIGLCAVGAVIAAIFKKVDDNFVIEGEEITREMAPALWHDLERLSDSMGTAPPDHVIAGIDDNFFVTQMPVQVAGHANQDLRTVTGRTLFVSLSLLKKLPHQEADAVLLHELAHFSGNDTTYTQKISPLLSRYGHYLQGLYEGGISRPVFYFAVMFRALYELSLGKLSRQREFRADRLASEKTSPESMAHALLRITAYSQYRNELEQEFFEAEEAHEQVNLSQRIDGGFQGFTTAFVDKRDVGQLATAHPFDSHPPLQQRLEALGFRASPDAMRDALYDDSLGPWFEKIDGADELERAQWNHYEERFRQFHEQVLAYRYIPSNEAEQELVEKFFPPVERTAAKDRAVQFNFERVVYEDWDQPLYYREIEGITLETEWGTRLDIVVKRDGKSQTIKLPVSKKQNEMNELIGTMEQYYGRAATAIAYQASLQQEDNPLPDAPLSNETFSME